MANSSRQNTRIPPLIRNIYRFIFPSLPEYLKKELKGCETVLDLGCGSGESSPFQYFRVPHSVGVEIHGPSLEECRRRKIHTEYIQADIRQVAFPERSFDAVLLLNIIEHFPREDSLRLLEKCEKWAKKKLIIATPNGFLLQDGYNNNPFQKHQSGWNVNELQQLGFKVKGFNGWQRLRGYRAIPRYKPALLWEVISDITQIVTSHRPNCAFRLFGVKVINE